MADLATPSMTGSSALPRRDERCACAAPARLPFSSLTLSGPVPMLDKPKIDPALLARFTAIVGEKFAITDPNIQAPYLVEQRNMFQGHTPAVLRPSTVAEVSAIARLANDTGTPIVPQGGNTGLVGGQVSPHHAIVLSLNP